MDSIGKKVYLNPIVVDALCEAYISYTEKINAIVAEQEKIKEVLKAAGDLTTKKYSAKSSTQDRRSITIDSVITKYGKEAESLITVHPVEYFRVRKLTDESE